MSERQKTELIDMALSGLGDFDPPLRELENIDYLFELEMDYGAYREYKRHRMQTTLSQPLNARYGHLVPRLIERAGAGRLFREAIKKTDHAFRQVEKVHPSVARYLVTHAHMTRTLAKLNLRECYHLLKLRLSSQAHFTIQELARQMHRHIENVHPRLIRYIRLRDAAE